MNTNNRLDFDTVVEKCQYLYVDDCENMTEEEVVGDVCSQIESMGWTCISEWEDPTDFIDDIEGCKDCGSILNSELELSYNLGGSAYFDDDTLLDIGTMYLDITFYGVWGVKGVFIVNIV